MLIEINEFVNRVNVRGKIVVKIILLASTGADGSITVAH
jgi:hypothetical protein